jgi:hypothetical protein
MMTKSKWQRVFAVTLVVALLTSTFGTAAFAAEQAVVLQQSAGTELTATVPGGQFAKIYLGLTPKEPGTVTVRAEWDRENPGQNGVGFYVLDEADLTAVVNGASVQTNNLATGDPTFFQGGPNNVQGAGFAPPPPATRLSFTRLRRRRQRQVERHQCPDHRRRGQRDLHRRRADH